MYVRGACGGASSAAQPGGQGDDGRDGGGRLGGVRGAAVPDRGVPLEDGRFAPVCAEHQAVVDAAGAPFDVEPLQQELLATYAVPLLRGEAYSADGT
jgi:hypothetical protein